MAQGFSISPLPINLLRRSSGTESPASIFRFWRETFHSWAASLALIPRLSMASLRNMFLNSEYLFASYVGFSTIDSRFSEVGREIFFTSARFLEFFFFFFDFVPFFPFGSSSSSAALKAFWYWALWGNGFATSTSNWALRELSTLDCHKAG